MAHMTKAAPRRSSYYASCPKCGDTNTPHATIGLPCPSVEKRGPLPEGQVEHLAHLALRSVHRPESLELLRQEVGSTQALKMHAWAQQRIAADQRRKFALGLV